MLVRKCVEAASATGAGFVLLVGDEPYYGPLGFLRVSPGRVGLPGPVAPHRLLLCPSFGLFYGLPKLPKLAAPSLLPALHPSIKGALSDP